MVCSLRCCWFWGYLLDLIVCFGCLVVVVYGGDCGYYSILFWFGLSGCGGWSVGWQRFVLVLWCELGLCGLCTVVQAFWVAVRPGLGLGFLVYFWAEWWWWDLVGVLLLCPVW